MPGLVQSSPKSGSFRFKQVTGFLRSKSASFQDSSKSTSDKISWKCFQKCANAKVRRVFFTVIELSMGEMVWPDSVLFGNGANSFQTHKNLEKTKENENTTSCVTIKPMDISWSLLLTNMSKPAAASSHIIIAGDTNSVGGCARLQCRACGLNCL